MPESPTVTLTWHACEYKVQKLHLRYILKEDLVLTRMAEESYRRRLMSLLLYLCYVFRVLINFRVCRF